jgi:hypothetical protein
VVTTLQRWATRTMVSPFKSRVEAVAAKLPLQQIFAPLDRFVTMAALVPLADPIACGGRGNEIEPIQAGVRGLAG